MTTTVPGRRWRHLLVDRTELAAIAAMAATVTLWGCPSRGWAALDLIPFGIAIAYLCILTGRVVIGAGRLPAARFSDVPTLLLVGFLALNMLLLAASLALPLSLPLDAVLIAAGVVGWAVRSDPPPSRSPASAPGLASLVLSLAAATLWSLDSIEPTITTGGSVFYTPWADSYTHACLIRIFRDAHGIFSLEHFSMAGEPAPFYHYASFLIPALLAATTQTSCYLAFATFLVPLGMVLTGLAAFVLARWWWGPGAGLAASAGVLLLPDPSRYGVANPFLGYYWLAETGPTMVYGVAMIAVAWVLVFEGCREGRWGLVVAGFVAAGLSVAFKAHLFVANAFLIWVYPAFFLRGIASRTRLCWLAFSVATFVVAVRISERSNDVPLLRLDGSGLKPYITGVISNLDSAEMKQRFAIGPATSWLQALLVGLVHLTLGTLGAYAILLPVVAFLLIRSNLGTDRRARVETALFPFLVVVNYLVMALGLAIDDRTNHMPEELLHRPLVWAYFAVAAWTSGCCYECVLKPHLARPGPARTMVAALLISLLGVPLYYGQGVQVGPAWGKQYTPMRVPVGLVRSAEFLRDHSARGDVVQNSEDDRWIMLGALAERPVYVADTWRTRTQTNARILRRLEEMASFRRLTDPTAIVSFAADRKIAWYVLDPATRILWPASILAHPSFESAGFRVYHFPSGR